LQAKELADSETQEILANYRDFLDGRKSAAIVPSMAISDRLDAKSCMSREDDVADKWRQTGLEVLRLGDIVDHITDEEFNPKDHPNTRYVFLRVRYDRIPEEGEERLGREITYSSVQNPKHNDLVVSNIAMALGALCVLPKDLEHTLASSEFTIMRLKDPRFDPWYLWGYLRSPEIRARLLSKATGISRHRVSWDFLSELPVPLVDDEVQRSVSASYQESIRQVRESERLRSRADRSLDETLDLTNKWALKRLRAAKPPK
jgi:restriction endonuclease S subunit